MHVEWIDRMRHAARRVCVRSCPSWIYNSIRWKNTKSGHRVRRCPKKIQTQLLEVAREIASKDFPDPWSSLLPEALATIQSGDTATMQGSLLMLRRVVSCLEFTIERNSVLQVLRSLYASLASRVEMVMLGLTATHALGLCCSFSLHCSAHAYPFPLKHLPHALGLFIVGTRWLTRSVPSAGLLHGGVAGAGAAASDGCDVASQLSRTCHPHEHGPQDLLVMHLQHHPNHSDAGPESGPCLASGVPPSARRPCICVMWRCSARPSMSRLFSATAATMAPMTHNHGVCRHWLPSCNGQCPRQGCQLMTQSGKVIRGGSSASGRSASPSAYFNDTVTPRSSARTPINPLHGSFLKSLRKPTSKYAS
jgi:hypothetical protein